MATIKTWKAPLLGEDRAGVARGSLCHYAEERYSPFNGKSFTSSDYGSAAIDWVAPETTFTATLTLDHMLSGRSAKYVMWKTDEDNPKTHPMFIAELITLLKTGDVKEGGILTGKFGFVKRGKNFGITYLGKS